jgi:hypothetical protein
VPPTITRAKPGPKPRPWVDIKVAITPELDQMLNQLVVSSGISKAALVRDALARWGESLGYLAAGSADHITPTLTGGLGVAPLRRSNRS